MKGDILHCVSYWSDPPLLQVQQELYKATPREVWDEYFANGYSWERAVNEELSYGEPVYELRGWR
jgi:hypothetical protein